MIAGAGYQSIEGMLTNIDFVRNRPYHFQREFMNPTEREPYYRAAARMSYYRVNPRLCMSASGSDHGGGPPKADRQIVDLFLADPVLDDELPQCYRFMMYSRPPSALIVPFSNGPHGLSIPQTPNDPDFGHRKFDAYNVWKYFFMQLWHMDALFCFEPDRLGTL